MGNNTPGQNGNRLPLSTQSVVTGVYCPLHLQGPGWSLRFQLEPTPQIIRKGGKIPAAELVRAVGLCGLPAILVEVLQVVAACTPVSEGEQDGVRASTEPDRITPSYHAAWRATNGLPPLGKKDTTWSTGDTDPDRPVSGFPFDITPQ